MLKQAHVSMLEPSSNVAIPFAHRVLPSVHCSILAVRDANGCLVFDDQGGRARIGAAKLKHVGYIGAKAGPYKLALRIRLKRYPRGAS